MSTVSDVAAKVRDFVAEHLEIMPLQVAEHIVGSQELGYPDERIVIVFAETIYANRGRAGINPDAILLASQCAAAIAEENLQPSIYNRAEAMNQAMRRDAGAPPPKGGHQDVSEDPSINEAFWPRTPTSLIEEGSTNGSDTSANSNIAQRRRAPVRSRQHRKGK